MRSYQLSLAAVALLAGAASAQDVASRAWTGGVGIGVATLPRHVGSAEYRTQAIPYLLLEYRGTYTLGAVASGVGFGVGRYIVRSPSLTWQVDVAQTTTREERYGPALAGMGDRDGRTYAGSNIAYSLGFLSASNNLVIGLNADEGAYGTVRLAARKGIGMRWAAELASAATYATGDHMASEFGVSGPQAARRQILIDAGDPRLREGDGEAYAPTAGLKETQVSASLVYLFAAHHSVVMFANATRLADEAAASSLVRERIGKTAGMMIVYGF